jgi:hypothetical protein
MPKNQQHTHPHPGRWLPPSQARMDVITPLLHLYTLPLTITHSESISSQELPSDGMAELYQTADVKLGMMSGSYLYVYDG